MCDGGEILLNNCAHRHRHRLQQLRVRLHISNARTPIHAPIAIPSTRGPANAAPVEDEAGAVTVPVVVVLPVALRLLAGEVTVGAALLARLLPDRGGLGVTDRIELGEAVAVGETVDSTLKG